MSEKRNWSYLTKLIIAFLILLLFATLWNLWAYHNAESALRSEVMENNLHATEQLSAKMHEITETSFSTLRTLELNADFRKILSSLRTKNDLTGYQRYELRTMIKAMQRPPFEEIFLYFPQMDYIISSNSGASELDICYNIFFPNDARLYGDWVDLLSSYHLASVEPYRYLPEKNTAMLLISVSEKIGSVPDLTIGCILNHSAMMDMIADTSYAGGQVCILNRNRRIIASSDVAGNRIPFDFQPDEKQFSFDARGTNYVANRVESSYGLQYLSFVPSDTYWQKLNAFRKGILLGLAIFLVISSALIMLLTREVYKPLSGVINHIRDNSGRIWNKKTENEITYLGSTFSGLMSENRNIHQELAVNRNLLKRHFLFELLNGIPAGRPWREEFERNGIPLLSDLFAVAIIHMEGMRATAGMKELQDAGKQLEMLSCPEYSITAFDNENDVFVLLINLKETDQTLGQDIARAIRHQINRLSSHVCTIAVSSVRRGSEGISLCYSEAKALIEYRSVDGAGSIMLPDRINHQIQFSQTKFSREEPVLQAYLTAQSEETPESVYDLVFSHCFDSVKISIQDAVAFTSHYRSLMIEMAHRILGDFDPMLMSRAEQLVNSDTLPVFRYHCCLFMSHVRNVYQSRQETNSLGRQISEYCELHYMDPNLCINTLGEVFGLSPAYLSHQFKQQTKLGLPEFLTDLRLKHATDYLLHSDMRIEDIAELVGIPSITSFNRIFKKKYTIPPGVYRQTYKHTQNS